MKYVIDASVAVSWVLNEPQTPKALVVRSRVISGALDLLAPDVFPIEVAHALSRAERKGILVPPQGTTALLAVLRTLPTLYESLPLLACAFEVSSKERMGVYDCLYLALAEREQAPLITADRRLLSLSGFPTQDLSTF